MHTFRRCRPAPLTQTSTVLRARGPMVLDEDFDTRLARGDDRAGLTRQAALWQRVAHLIAPDEVRWIVSPISLLDPVLGGYAFATDRQLIMLLGGIPRREARQTVQLPYRSLLGIGPTEVDDGTFEIVVAGQDDPHLRLNPIDDVDFWDLVWTVQEMLISRSSSHDQGPFRAMT